MAAALDSRAKLLAAALGALYFAAAWLGQLVTLPSIPFPAFWLPGGIQVVAYLSCPRRRWPALAGVFAVADLAFDATAGLDAVRTAVFAVVNVGEALLAASLLARLLGVPPRLARVRDVLTVVGTAAVATIASGAASATILTAAFGLPFARMLVVWVTGGMLGMVTVTTLAYAPRGPVPGAPRARAPEVVALTVVAALSVLPMLVGRRVAAPSLQFVLVPGLIWTAIRFGARAVALLCAAVAVVALVGLRAGTGEFASTAMAPDALTAYLQLFSATLLVCHAMLALLVRTRAEALEQVRAAGAALRDEDRRKNEFLGMLSHELRNPLAPISSSVEVLERVDPAGEQGRRAREVIRRQVRHLTRLVDDLLDVTRIARGKMQLHLADVDLADLLRRVGEDYRSLFHDRGIELVVEAPREPVPVHGDETRLAQLTGNLLHNAAKFTTRGGRVTLSTARSRGGAEIVVADTGAGLEPALLERIFEPFTQGPQSPARSEGGLGLGLALVRGIAELHGGKARAESAGRGRGTRIVVRLPVAALVGTAAVRRPPPDRVRPRQHVLVVDDNRDAAESLAEVIKVLGHAAEVAYDGPSAVRMARAHRPDLVLCDLALPGMSGYDVAVALRAAYAGRIRLVAVSGYAQPEDVRRAHEAGFDAHLAKPANLDQIERLLRAPCARQDAAGELGGLP